MPGRLMVGQQPLELLIMVRIHAGQHTNCMDEKFILRSGLLVEQNKRRRKSMLGSTVTLY